MSRFHEMLLSYVDAFAQQRAEEVESALWDEFGVTGAVAIFDMSGFTRVTQRHGVIHFLSMIRLMQVTTQPLIEARGGQVLKFEADNCFARFDEVAPAIDAAFDLRKAMRKLNKDTPDAFDFKLSCGIDYGHYLLVEEGTDYFGAPVNRACKLGEDLASAGEILITRKAWETLENPTYAREERHYSISGVEIPAFCLMGPRSI